MNSMAAVPSKSISHCCLTPSIQRFVIKESHRRHVCRRAICSRAICARGSNITLSFARFDAPQMALVLGQQVLEFVEQLFGNVRLPSELAEMRNYSSLRLDVALAFRNMALRHFQSGLAVHSNSITPKAKGLRLPAQKKGRSEPRPFRLQFVPGSSGGRP